MDITAYPNVTVYRTLRNRTDIPLLPVKNQFSTNSCWALTCAELLGVMHAIEKKSPHIEMSPQEMVDLLPVLFGDVYRNQPDLAKDVQYGTYKSKPDYFLPYLQRFGLSTEADYPWALKRNHPDDMNGMTQRDRYRPTRVNAHECQEYFDLATIVDGLGKCPAIGLMKVDDHSHYRRGEPLSIPNGNMGHCVLIVGYAIINGQLCFEFKNSYGETWGEGGYAFATADSFGGVVFMHGIEKMSFPDPYRAEVAQEGVDFMELGNVEAEIYN